MRYKNVVISCKRIIKYIALQFSWRNRIFLNAEPWMERILYWNEIWRNPTEDSDYANFENSFGLGNRYRRWSVLCDFRSNKAKVIASINSWSFCYLSTDLKSGLKVGRNRQILHKFDFIYAIIESMLSALRVFMKDFNKSDRVLLN
jgi:hypothetical protein